MMNTCACGYEAEDAHDMGTHLVCAFSFPDNLDHYEL